ncbi:inner membrane protein YrbG [Candidatus Phycosocius bacilliformis]|uniref:Inner membrane protein YrbG n=1 Tax=Candidatus Phycosocius bacilliformis TaxID=1445552 RepID=A0A2P2E9L0_9PROT|nr:calcium/sodium antiporter [Candidatus Phycosocius bacilliformis]GBF57728.1 inner membrane protein YrbG [Candidatus Phycosocius bacilliformis]
MEIAISLAVGLALLVLGGDLLVRGSVTAARNMGVSPLLIGLTLVGFGTSTPELVTSVTAALEGSPGIAVGNVVGSNIANVLLILGASAVIFPLVIDPKGFKRDVVVLIASTLALLAVVLVGFMPSWVGVVFILALFGYVYFVYRQEKAHPDEAAVVLEHRVEDAPKGPKGVLWPLVMSVAGIAITIVGARYFVGGAVDLAKGFGISDTIIGLTVVAVGTSMPELVTSITAAFRKHADVAYGNIVGSNIFNVLFVLGATSLVKPIEIPDQIIAFDIWVLLATTALLVLFARTGLKLLRWEGLVFVGGFIAYTGYLIHLA